MYVFYPRVTCPECLSSELTWTSVTGCGRLISFAEVHKAHHPAFNDEVPIMFVAVRLDEGPVVFGRLSDVAPTSLCIGAIVEIDREATRTRGDIPLFKLA